MRAPRPDGTSRDTYFNLKQEGTRITGTIRTTQFYFRIAESTGGPDGFTIADLVTKAREECQLPLSSTSGSWRE